MENAITMTRGDTLILEVLVYDTNGNAYNPALNDTITMTVRENDANGEILFQKESGDLEVEIITGGWRITVLPVDTAGKDYIPYVYDIEVVLVADSYKQTIIPISPFILGEEVTYAAT